MTGADYESVPTGHFDALYARSEDPWEYQHGNYEQQKYASTLAALPRRRYRAGFELGCSIGVLTRMLAERCEAILGVDCSAKAIALAREKNPARNIEYQVMRAPEGLPQGLSFDLIVLSEVLYFFSPADLAAVAAFVRGAAMPSATIMLVNYLGPTGHAASGDQSADRFINDLGDAARVIERLRHEYFRIDVLQWAGDAGG